MSAGDLANLFTKVLPISTAFQTCNVWECFNPAWSPWHNQTRPLQYPARAKQQTLVEKTIYFVPRIAQNASSSSYLLNGVFWCVPLSLKGIFGGAQKFACCLLNEQTDRPVSFSPHWFWSRDTFLSLTVIIRWFQLIAPCLLRL